MNKSSVSKRIPRTCCFLMFSEYTLRSRWIHNPSSFGKWWVLLLLIIVPFLCFGQWWLVEILKDLDRHSKIPFSHEDLIAGKKYIKKDMSCWRKDSENRPLLFSSLSFILYRLLPSLSLFTRGGATLSNGGHTPPPPKF